MCVILRDVFFYDVLRNFEVWFLEYDVGVLGSINEDINLVIVVLV